jgi:hypothetical protein
MSVLAHSYTVFLLQLECFIKGFPVREAFEGGMVPPIAVQTSFLDGNNPPRFSSLILGCAHEAGKNVR